MKVGVKQYISETIHKSNAFRFYVHVGLPSWLNNDIYTHTDWIKESII